MRASKRYIGSLNWWFVLVATIETKNGALLTNTYSTHIVVLLLSFSSLLSVVFSQVFIENPIYPSSI